MPRLFKKSPAQPVPVQSAAPAAAPAQEPGLLERIFGASPAQTEAPQVLAYANPEDAGLRGPALTNDFSPRKNFSHGLRSAIYDVDAHSVTLPNGEKLELHSGQSWWYRGQYIDMMDNSRYSKIQMHGPTPSSREGVVYMLKPRESSFHGVQALRLTPIKGNTWGRIGLLAHTFMLGPDGQSNGCMSFRDYQRFLTAFKSGMINSVIAYGHYDPVEPDPNAPRATRAHRMPSRDRGRRFVRD